MVEYAPSNEPEASKRRSTRVVLTIPLTITGVDALGQPFRERTSTLTVNCHGFKYQSKHYVLRGTWLEVEVPNTEAGKPPQKVRGHVCYVLRPRSVKELFQVGVEMEAAHNLWGVAFPPDDWIPFEQPHKLELREPPPGVEPEESRQPSAAEPVSRIRAAQPTPIPAARTAPAGEGTAVYPFSPASAAEISASVNRQITRMLADAQEQIQRAAREASVSAISREASSLLRELNVQFQAAAEKAVEQAASVQVERALRRALEQIEAAREGGERQVRATWSREIEIGLREATERLQQKLAEMGQTFSDKFSQQISADAAAAAGRLTEIETRLRELHGEAASDAEKIPVWLENARKELDAVAEDAKKQWSKRLTTYAESGLSRLAELDEAAKKLQERIQAASDAAHTGWRQKLEHSLAEADSRFEEMAETTLESVQHDLADRIAEASAGAASSAAEDMNRRAGELRTMMSGAALEAERRIGEAQASLDEKLLKTQARAAEIEEATARVRDESRKLEETARNASAEVLRQFEDMLAANREQLQGQAESALAGWTQRLEQGLQERGADMVKRVAADVEKQVASELQRAQRIIKKLKDLEALAEETLSKEQARLQSEFEKASRTLLTRCLEELDAKSTDATHNTFEQLYKSAEWYQRKAQAAMQTAFEKGLTQAATQLREKAAEISTMFASELEYYSRSYSGHTQGLLDEAAKEMAGRMRAQLGEAAEAGIAKFSDEIHRLAEEKLERLQSAGGGVVDETRARMAAQVDEASRRVEEHAAKAGSEFQQRMAERVHQGMKEAKEGFQTQIQPVLEGWRAEARAHQDQWLKTLDRKGDESVEQLKTRLENVSNSWMVAAVTSLGQHSQTVLDALAKAVEQRLRETCAEVLAGVGENMRQRLLGISDDLKKK
ncbi:MAG TPA: hypothetical protein VGQ11_13800 [Candidatus Acidoferrales bacterium]|nr:hypothetical protein [Candidatus Acidoferrales bacterium]